MWCCLFGRSTRRVSLLCLALLLFGAPAFGNRSQPLPAPIKAQPIPVDVLKRFVKSRLAENAVLRSLAQKARALGLDLHLTETTAAIAANHYRLCWLVQNDVGVAGLDPKVCENSFSNLFRLGEPITLKTVGALEASRAFEAWLWATYPSENWVIDYEGQTTVFPVVTYRSAEAEFSYLDTLSNLALFLNASAEQPLFQALDHPGVENTAALRDLSEHRLSLRACTRSWKTSRDPSIVAHYYLGTIRLLHALSRFGLVFSKTDERTLVSLFGKLRKVNIPSLLAAETEGAVPVMDWTQARHIMDSHFSFAMAEMERQMAYQAVHSAFDMRYSHALFLEWGMRQHFFEFADVWISSMRATNNFLAFNRAPPLTETVGTTSAVNEPGSVPLWLAANDMGAYDALMHSRVRHPSVVAWPPHYGLPLQLREQSYSYMPVRVQLDRVASPGVDYAFFEERSIVLGLRREALSFAENGIPHFSNVEAYLKASFDADLRNYPGLRLMARRQLDLELIEWSVADHAALENRITSLLENLDTLDPTDVTYLDLEAMKESVPSPVFELLIELISWPKARLHPKWWNWVQTLIEKGRAGAVLHHLVEFHFERGRKPLWVRFPKGKPDWVFSYVNRRSFEKDVRNRQLLFDVAKALAKQWQLYDISLSGVRHLVQMMRHPLGNELEGWAATNRMLTKAMKQSSRRTSNLPATSIAQIFKKGPLWDNLAQLVILVESFLEQDARGATCELLKVLFPSKSESSEGNAIDHVFEREGKLGVQRLVKVFLKHLHYADYPTLRFRLLEHPRVISLPEWPKAIRKILRLPTSKSRIKPHSDAQLFGALINGSEAADQPEWIHLVQALIYRWPQAHEPYTLTSYYSNFFASRVVQRHAAFSQIVDWWIVRGFSEERAMTEGLFDRYQAFRKHSRKALWLQALKLSDRRARAELLGVTVLPAWADVVDDCGKKLAGGP